MEEQLRNILRQKEGAPLQLDPRRTALLVIDAQHNFVRPDGPFGRVFEALSPGLTRPYFDRVRSVAVPCINQLQTAFRAHRLPIIYTGTGTCMHGGQDLAGWLRAFDELGTQVLGERIWPGVEDPAWQIDETIAPRPGELVINKTAAGALGCTVADQTLRNLGVTSVIVTGFTTDVCVSTTARECADRGFYTIIAEDACATLSEEMHRVSLEIFSLAFGRVQKTADLLRAFSQYAVA